MCRVKVNVIGSPLGSRKPAETRSDLGPFEPDLVHTSVGKWSRCLNDFIILRPLHFGAAFAYKAACPLCLPIKPIAKEAIYMSFSAELRREADPILKPFLSIRLYWGWRPGGWKRSSLFIM